MKFLSLLVVFGAALPDAEVATLNDWPSYGGTHAALRYSALDQINTDRNELRIFDDRAGANPDVHAAPF
ncbi:MAG: hypothetical protein ABSB35_26160 [Bryobacteraceae bacterium]|jgi:hypothetical protein